MSRPLEKGNIDLTNRIPVPMEDGSIATVRSMSFNDGKREVLIPTVVNGAVVSNEDAINHYFETGEHLGKFETPEKATRYAERLHRKQERMYARGPGLFQRLMNRRGR